MSSKKLRYKKLKIGTKFTKCFSNIAGRTESRLQGFAGGIQ
jgi:hypothetical protein